MKITTETALQWCAEIVPEWDGLFDIYFKRMPDIWNDRNASARLVEAFVGEDYKREKLYEQAVHRQIAGELGGYISTYRMMRATPREQALAVLSAYKGEMVEVEDE